MTTTYADRHDAEHGDRTEADTRYIEVCWRCAEDWLAYTEAHPDALQPGTYAVATKPERAAYGLHPAARLS